MSHQSLGIKPIQHKPMEIYLRQMGGISFFFEGLRYPSKGLLHLGGKYVLDLRAT